MHKMDDTPKILTIMGLIIEGMAFIVFAVLTVFSRILADIPKEDWLAQGMTEMEADLAMNLINVFSVIFIVIGVILLIMFLVNLALFTLLIKGRFSEQTAVKIYIYQAVWGGVSLLFNTITGILYLISAIQAQNRRKGNKPKEGI